jgi:hypothetical protein
MRLIVLHNPKNKTGRWLQRTVEALHLNLQVVYLETIASLMETLTRCVYSSGIAVFQIGDGEDLDALVSLKEWLRDLQIILVLPDQGPATIAKGHLLNPRFVTFVNGDLQHVGTVVEKLVAYSNRTIALTECRKGAFS